MATLPGLICLIIYLLVRPFDFFPALAGYPLLYVFFFLAVAGYLTDLSRGALRWSPAPTLGWVLAFMIWAIITVGLKASHLLWESTLRLTMIVSVYFLIAHGVQSRRSFSVLTGTLLLCTLVVGAVCIHQGNQPLQCVAFRDDTEEVNQLPGVPDGRPCAKRSDCYQVPEDREFTMECERVGLGGNHSVQGRVRYVGILQDPNEVALMVCLGIPLAIARYQNRRSFARLVAVCLSVIVAGTVAVMSQSRGGQLVFLTILFVYFIKRFGVKGLLLALPLCLPVLMYGGRSDENAEGSTLERLDCAVTGIQMFFESRGLGVGYDQFTDYNPVTAHNSFILVASELGVPGMVLWGMVVWLCIKTCWTPLREPEPGTEDTYNWSLALLALLAGLLVGIAFLSFSYHFLLWIVFGVVSAFRGDVSRQQRKSPLRVRPRDVAWVLAAQSVLFAFLFVYARLSGV